MFTTSESFDNENFNFSILQELFSSSGERVSRCGDLEASWAKESMFGHSHVQQNAESEFYSLDSNGMGGNECKMYLETLLEELRGGRYFYPLAYCNFWLLYLRENKENPENPHIRGEFYLQDIMMAVRLGLRANSFNIHVAKEVNSAESVDMNTFGERLSEFYAEVSFSVLVLMKNSRVCVRDSRNCSYQKSKFFPFRPEKNSTLRGMTTTALLIARAVSSQKPKFKSHQ